MKSEEFNEYVSLLDGIHEKLATWYERNARDLPWRERYSEYEVWIAEVMLQQTQIETIVPFFRRWMKKLPTLGALAKVEDDDAYKLWEGLGYYARCGNLKKTANILKEKHGGKLPRDLKQLVALPGIGEYTAGAIMNIAFEIPAPMVDGNVFRVLSRVLDWDKPISIRLTKRVMNDSSFHLMRKGEPRNVAQALMELGALVCRKPNPDCESCPLILDCRARANGSVDRRPVTLGPEKILPLDMLHFVARDQTRVLLRKPSDEGWWGKVWCFPWCRKENLDEFAAKTGLAPGKSLMRFTHRVTHYKVVSHVHEFTPGEDFSPCLSEFEFVAKKSLPKLSMSLPSSRIREMLLNKKEGRGKKR